MLPSSRRVPRALFEEVLKGSAFHAPHLYMRLIASSFTEKGSRFSFVAPKKVARTAATRNNLRRKGYRALQTLLPYVKPGVAGVFFYKTKETLLTEALKSEVRGLLQKAKVLTIEDTNK